jgi:hypothetical protein
MCYSDGTYMLAERKSIGSVAMCTCGTMHLTVGGVTLRLAPGAFGEMLRMCEEAADRLVMEAEMTPGASRLAH